MSVRPEVCGSCAGDDTMSQPAVAGIQCSCRRVGSSGGWSLDHLGTRTVGFPKSMLDHGEERAPPSSAMVKKCLTSCTFFSCQSVSELVLHGQSPCRLS